MKLVTFEADGVEMAGAITAEGQVASLSRAAQAVSTFRLPDSLMELLEEGSSGLDSARAVMALLNDAVASGPTLSNAAKQRVVYDLSDVRLLCPIPQPRKFIGIGLNYRDHAEEQGARIPAAPIMFAKFANSLIGAKDDIRYPAVTGELDYEAELGVIIGESGRDISAADAYRHVAGYCIVNDVTARDVQLKDRQWVRGKTLDAMTPVGPYLVTPDEVSNPDGLRVRLWLNGDLLQDSSTNQLIFDVPAIIAHVSQDITLQPGDIIATGTPGGVGFARKPPIYMQRGDVVVVEIEQLGRLENRIV